MCSNADSGPDSTDTDSERTLTDDELFDLDIVDGEDPLRAVDPDDRYRPDPPGPDPTVGTRFATLQDGSFAIIERAALGAWISADETINLEDAR
ncbi:hypothetical protein EFA46_015350 (plasmid) [Halarchaeum sp. CBA1220]|uniref:hypothetical protein n=1 Tax=Halarchaeum sp. CBA1220 TaxID=1853682 RepID=UPI000F3AA3F1|nr:hypothetical protein [Halarchaeum sp. CBA1220]QLC35635.1 hypothetical protein EFA46_015350 [Halarchaeum sp. CBA1220]